MSFGDDTLYPPSVEEIEIRNLKAHIAALEAEIELLRTQQRFGTPFDPTGAKTGTEINGLRAENERLVMLLEMTLHSPSAMCTGEHMGSVPCDCVGDAIRAALAGRKP